ncbi:right-handed parallel beta-helix repeat-containing protein [Flavobacterium sp. ZB4P13]|uniref:right-handed parallel beta-helix repeat-containing protein n=1 Tax=Flavobacterium sp. ZB4P13 TaxID=3401728 RepID=UPI003AABAB02
MNKISIIFISMFCTCLTVAGQAQNMIQASSFGIRSNSFENASQGIKKTIEFCKGKPNVTLVLPGGRIDLWPEGAYKRELYISNTTEDDTLSKVKNIGFLLENFKNLTIEGNNTLIVLHGKMVSFAILNSENVQLKNIRFDYERPTMSELTISSVSPNSIETVIHPDSKYLIDNGQISFYGEGWKSKSYHAILFEADKSLMKYSSFEPFSKSKAIQTSPLHVTFQGHFSKSSFRPGDILTIREAYRDNCGGFIHLSKNIKLENVKMHFMHGLGIISQFTENISFSKVIVAPQENSGRIIASFADCFHFSGCKGKILIDGCLTSGSHDDPINVHGTHMKIMAVAKDKKITVRFMHHQTYGFEAFFAKDSIVFVNPQTLMPVGYAKLKTAKLINKREMELELDGELPVNLKIGDCIENITWTPEVTIRNSRFERTNTRGLLLTTRRKILIENNTFYRTGMHAILIANDASSWFESGSVQDVTIRNNTFEECAYNSAPDNYIIAIAPENHQLVNGYYVHRNIRIENNTFKVYDRPIMTARSTDGLVFSNNTINQSNLLNAGTNESVFRLTACKNVVIQKNKFNTTWLPKITLDQMSEKELKTDVKTLKNK